MKGIFLLATSIMLASAGSYAKAAVTVWTLENVIFTDGGTATGSFAYDPELFEYSDPLISTAGGTVLAPHTYTAANTTINIPDFGLKQITFMSNTTRHYLWLTFDVPLTNAGGLVALKPSESFECYTCVPFRLVASGAVRSSGAVPEPASWALMITGFGSVGFAMRRRRSQLALAKVS